MILVKTLIVLFFILLALYVYDHLHLLSYFDGREGFENNVEEEEKDDDDDMYSSEAIMKKSQEMANEMIELKFTEKSPIESYENMANDATSMSELQEKMNELLKLKAEAISINKDLKK